MNGVRAVGRDRGRRIRRCLSRFLAVGVVVALAACGSSAQQSAAPAAPAASAAPDPSTIVIGYSAWPGWWPWAIAEKRGFFRANGVRVELRWYDSYLQSVQDLAAGRIDANAQTVSDTLAFSGRDGGIDQSIVLVNDISVGNDKIVARGGIDSVGALKGKRIAVEPGVVDDVLLTRALVKAGLGRQDVTIVPLETSKAEQAFVDGDVDAFAAFPPFWTRGLAVPGAHEIASSAQFPWTIWDVLAVDRDLVAKRPRDVQAIVDSWVDVLDHMTLESDDAFSLIADRAGTDVSDRGSVLQLLELQEGTQIYSLADMRKAFDEGASPDRLSSSLKEQGTFLLENGLVDRLPDTGGLLAPQFVRAASKRAAP